MIWIAVLVAVVTSVAGDFFLQQGSTAIKSSDNVLFKIFRQPKTLFGISLLTIHFAALSVAFRKAPITLVVPLMATTYIFNTIIARTILHEEVNWLRWAGVAVIALGVIVLGFGA